MICTWSDDTCPFRMSTLLLSTFLPHYLPDPIGYFFFENFLPVFRHSHYMQMNRIHRMRTVSAFSAHTANLNSLKLSPKGEGFSPHGRQ